MTLRRGPIDQTPAADTTGRAVLHLFGGLDPAFDAAALAGACGDLADAGGVALTFAVLGHKADAGVLLVADDPWPLRRTQAAIQAAGLRLVDSFLSITEISEYAANLPDVAKRHRLRPVLPPEGAEAIAFYPMAKRRRPEQNWFELPFEDRSRLMHDHGAHGRQHAGAVVQLVTASTGLDDWEWGVTLFAADLPSLKHVVYDLRFDEVSARYSEFGPFVVGLLCEPTELAALATASR